MADQVLVTGGAGFIGSHTVVELLKAGYEPIIVDNFSNADASVLENITNLTGETVKCYEGDCSDLSLMSKIFEENAIVGTIHFAAYKSVSESIGEPIKYYENNINSLLTLIQVMKRYRVSDLVFSSSCTVYGKTDRLPVSESTPRNKAESPYGHSKQICEDILESTLKSKDYTFRSLALRYFNPIGAHPSGFMGELPLGVPNNLVPYVTQTAAGVREKLTVFGKDCNTPDGSCIRDYIHVVDVAKAHVVALNYLKKKPDTRYFEVFNLGRGEGNSVLEIIQTFERVNNIKVNYDFGPRRPGDVEEVYGSTEKSNRILNWKAELSLEDALRDAWRWEQNIRKKENIKS